MPARNRQLTGQYSGSPAVSIITDLEEIPPLLLTQGHHRKVIDQQNIGSGERLQQPPETAIGAGLGQIPEQLGSWFIDRSSPLQLSEVVERTGTGIVWSRCLLGTTT